MATHPENTPRKDSFSVPREHHADSREARGLLDARRNPRFKLEIDIRVYPRNSLVVHGHTVDISESGISAILKVEVPVGEIVRLEFDLPAGSVDITALVRQRNAFRYGFQFLVASTSQEPIGRTCTQLAMEKSLFEQSEPKKPGKDF